MPFEYSVQCPKPWTNTYPSGHKSEGVFRCELCPKPVVMFDKQKAIVHAAVFHGIRPVK